MATSATQNRWAILIGINGYHESLGTLNFCANDATLMQETLVSDCCGFSPENIVLLSDDQAKDRLPTFGNIHSWLGTWLSRPGPDDLVLVYFAGHGREESGQALLAPMDATLESLPVTGIPVGNLVDMLERCRAAQRVLLLDACHSGAGRDVATMSSGFRAAIDTGKGLYTIASCDADQISYEWPEKKHGVFTHYLVEALQHGAPVNAEGCVTLDAVYESSRAGILDWTAGKRLKQEPVRICRTKGDIPIATRSLSIEQQLEAARAQEETICRLREEVRRLRKNNEDLDKRSKSQDVPGRSKRSVPAKPVTVKEWREWVGERGPYAEIAGLPVILAGIGGCLVGGPLVGFGLLSTLLAASQAVAFVGGVLGAIVLGLGLPLVVWLHMHRIWNNKYCLYCSEVCFKGGDYVGGAAHAFAMGRAGVVQGSGGAVLVQLGDLAAANGDVDTARLLYECGENRWKNPYAIRALEALESEQE